MEKQPRNIEDLSIMEICQYLRMDREIYIPCLILKEEIEERLGKTIDDEFFNELCNDFDDVFEETIQENILDEIEDQYKEEK